MKKTLAIVILALILLCSCDTTSNHQENQSSSSETVIESEIETHNERPVKTDMIDFSPENLSSEDFLDDYNYFWDTLKDNYPFLGVAKREGINLEEIQSRYLAKISEVTTLQEFSDTMGEMMSEFNFTGHMAFVSPDSYSGYARLYIGLSDTSDTSHTNYLANVLSDTKTVASYSYLLGEDINLESKENSQTTSSFSTADVPNSTSSNVETKILEENKIAYVKISGFGHEDIENDGNILLPFYESTKDYPHLIIDIRGNGGGSDAYWNMNIANTLMTKKYEIKMPLLYNKTPQIMEYISADGFEQISIPLEEIEEDLPNLNPEDRKYLTDAVIAEQSIEPETLSDFGGKIWLLVDESVYSSSETFTMACKATGFATIVGTNTGGDGMGIDPMMFTLPNTGLVWRNSIFYSVNSDGSNNEEVGTTPDILIEEGQDALNICIDEINQT